MKHWTIAIGFSVFWAVANPAFACEQDSPTARMPGYSDGKADERAHQLWSDWRTIGHYMRTKALLEEAPKVYLGRITMAERLADFDTRALVKPMRAIKGELPSGIQTLLGFLRDSCGGASGDGDGAYAAKGDLIIVFDGLPKQTRRPNGIDSVNVVDVRNIELLDEVQSWLNSLPGYEPYD